MECIEAYTTEGGCSGMRRIINVEATITELEKTRKIPEACHEAL